MHGSVTLHDSGPRALNTNRSLLDQILDRSKFTLQLTHSVKDGTERVGDICLGHVESKRLDEGLVNTQDTPLEPRGSEHTLAMGSEYTLLPDLEAIRHRRESRQNGSNTFEDDGEERGEGTTTREIPRKRVQPPSRETEVHEGRTHRIEHGVHDCAVGAIRSELIDECLIDRTQVELYTSV